MLVKQLSVFMENKAGRLHHLTKTLGDSGIDLETLSIADTKDYGIVRFIASDNDKALKVLKEAGFTVAETQLIGVEVDDVAGTLAAVLELFDKNNINIEYLYSFAQTDRATAKILFRVEDNDRAVKLLRKENIRLLSGI